jgi:hypothetical protein
MRLHNEIKTVEIGGHPVRIGRLTMAAACEIETYLETLESPFERFDVSALKEHLPEATASEVADILMQQSATWPPDAIGALCDVRMVRRAKFGYVFIGAMIRAYNGHLKPDEIDRIVGLAFVPFDALAIQPIALGITDDPKDESGLPVASNPASGSSGGASQPS